MDIREVFRCFLFVCLFQSFVEAYLMSSFCCSSRRYEYFRLCFVCWCLLSPCFSSLQSFQHFPSILSRLMLPVWPRRSTCMRPWGVPLSRSRFGARAISSSSPSRLTFSLQLYRWRKQNRRPFGYESVLSCFTLITHYLWVLLFPWIQCFPSCC